jgi:hypothetical protein
MGYRQPFLCINPVSARTQEGVHQIYLQSSLLWSQFDLKSGNVRRFSQMEIGSVQLDDDKSAGNPRVGFDLQFQRHSIRHIN